MFKTNMTKQETAHMKPYEFASLPRTSTVAALVTMVASGWFILAGGAILTDRHSEYTVQSSRTPAAQVQAAPDAHFRIVVVASRAEAAAARL
jgi:hypothetical protein